MWERVNNLAELREWEQRHFVDCDHDEPRSFPVLVRTADMYDESIQTEMMDIQDVEELLALLRR